MAAVSLDILKYVFFYFAFVLYLAVFVSVYKKTQIQTSSR